MKLFGSIIFGVMGVFVIIPALEVSSWFLGEAPLLLMAILVYILTAVFAALLYCYIFLVCCFLVKLGIKEIKMMDLPEIELDHDVQIFCDKLTLLGFVPVGPTYEIKGTPGVFVSYVHEESSTYGTVLSSMTNLKINIGFTFSSLLKDSKGSLVTTDNHMMAGNLCHPGELYQVFEKAGVSALYDNHLTSLEHLRSKGFEIVQADIEAFHESERKQERRSLNTSGVLRLRLRLLHYGEDGLRLSRMRGLLRIRKLLKSRWFICDGCMVLRRLFLSKDEFKC